jgi:opacity protein-like surface antigen
MNLMISGGLMTKHAVLLAWAIVVAMIAGPNLASAQGMPPIWSGLYIGGHAGGASISRDEARTNPAGSSTISASNSGGIYGAFGGYSFQNGALVAGVEVDGTWNCSGGSACLYSARARLGYASGNFLLYGTGGIGWRDQSLTWVNSISGARVEQKDTTVGFVGGVGAEYRFAGNWALRGEVLFAHFNDADFVSPSGLTKVSVQDDFVIGRIGVSYMFR